MENENNYSLRLKAAREDFGPHANLAVSIGISTQTLQRAINGEPPKQRRIIDLIEKFLTKKGL